MGAKHFYTEEKIIGDMFSARILNDWNIIKLINSDQAKILIKKYSNEKYDNPWNVKSKVLCNLMPLYFSYNSTSHISLYRYFIYNDYDKLFYITMGKLKEGKVS